MEYKWAQKVLEILLEKNKFNITEGMGSFLAIEWLLFDFPSLVCI